MNVNHRYAHVVAWLGLYVSLLAMTTTIVGCDVASTGPVSVPQGTEVDPSPFLGTWRVVAEGSITMTEPVTVTITDSAGPGVDALIEYPDGTDSYVITPTIVTSHTVIMMPDLNGANDPREDDSLGFHWKIGTVRVEDGGDTLVVGSLSESVVATAVANQVVDGTTIEDAIFERTVSTIEAGPEAFRSYLEAHPEALDQPPHLYLSRIPPGGAGLLDTGWRLIAAMAIGLGVVAGMVYLRGLAERR